MYPPIIPWTYLITVGLGTANIVPTGPESAIPEYLFQKEIYINSSRVPEDNIDETVEELDDEYEDE